MLRNIKDLRGHELVATDEAVGKAEDFYFDDEKWTVRYLVARTGSWLKGRHTVLLSPMAIDRADWGDGRLHLRLTRAQVEGSPEIDVDQPVARHQELAYHQHFGWAGYWGIGAGIWGPFGLPGLLAQEPWRAPVTEAERRLKQEEERRPDAHLRSCKEVLGYHLQATDVELGHVDDFIVDDETWTLRYLVVDTSNGLFGHKRVLVSPRWVDKVSWAARKVFVGLGGAAIKSSPEWNPAIPITRTYEEQLHDHYARAGYWEPDEGVVQKRPEQADADEDAAIRPYPTDHDAHHPGMP